MDMPPATDSSDPANEGQESKPSKPGKQKAGPKSKAGAKKVSKKPAADGEIATETEIRVGEGPEAEDDDVEAEPPVAEKPTVMGKPAAAAGSEEREKLIQEEVIPVERETTAELKLQLMKKMADEDDADIVVSPSGMMQRWSEAQVRLRTSKRFQHVVAGVTIFAVFADILGTAIIMPGLASVCTFASGGPGDFLEQQRAAGLLTEEAFQEQTQLYISPHAFKGERGAWSGAPPVPFSLSMNLVMSLGFLGSAAGSMFFGWLCDRIGCKIPMQICLGMGILGYLIIYASAIWVKSYYLFMLGNVWNNFFGNCMQIASTYFGQLFDGAERDPQLRV
ncbi:unnamed protein product [Symbiodinium sp. CCMP2592]|nr:unnamed protein product [Symbiodinium sp. CCMP2592]